MKAWFKQRPHLKVTAIEKSAGVPAKTLVNHIGPRGASLKAEHREKIVEVLKLYGFGYSKAPAKKVAPDKPPKKSGTKKKESAPKDFTYTLCINYWFEWYKEQHGEKYAWDATAGTNVKGIIKKLQDKANDKGSNVTPIIILDAFKWLLSRVKEDEWLMNHCEPRHVNQNFNNLIVKKHGKSKPASATEITDTDILTYAANAAKTNSGG